jgi:hypothetical protein
MQHPNGSLDEVGQQAREHEGALLGCSFTALVLA